MNPTYFDDELRYITRLIINDLTASLCSKTDKD